MAPELPLEPFAQIARRVDPQARLLRTWTLQGGISAQMTALELLLPGERLQRVIVRRPHNPHAAADEFRILQLVQDVGVAAQPPYFVDASGEIFPDPYLVIGYVEGQPHFAPQLETNNIAQMAALLARIHSISEHSADLAFLPRQTDRLAQVVEQRPAHLDISLDEARIRDVLEAVWPLPPANVPALLHGDFWPGNLLWQDGRLAAVIDWEDAEVGDPLADLSITRLDLLWLYGRAAMQAFTRAYQAASPLDFSQLPYWDLVAALRPASRLTEWAEGWPALGRPDMTEESMRAAHRWFVAQALQTLA